MNFTMCFVPKKDDLCFSVFVKMKFSWVKPTYSRKQNFYVLGVKQYWEPKKGQKTNIVIFCKWKMDEKQKNLLGKLRKNQRKNVFDFWSKINSKHRFNSITARKICILQTVQKTWDNFQSKNTTIIDDFFRSQNQRNCNILRFYEKKF